MLYSLIVQETRDLRSDVRPIEHRVVSGDQVSRPKLGSS
jgi:hypothetical protein